MNILFYTTFSNRSRDVESLILSMRGDGDKVFFISHFEQGSIHDFLRSENIPVYTKTVHSKLFLYKTFMQWIYFITFCKRHKIDLVYSHLEYPNFIATLGQWFVKAKVIINRHHANDFILNKWSNAFSYRFTNKFASTCIVYSNYAKQVMVNEEGMAASKVLVMPLLYNFDLYSKSDFSKVEEYKRKYQAEVLLVCVGRLVVMKRVGKALQVLRSLRDKSIDARLIIIGDGPMRSELEHLSKTYQIQDRVHLIGHVNNVLDYLAASDFLIHPSVSESSCVVVKEAGLAHAVPIVCRGVGDFDDYLVDQQNAILVSKDHFEEEAVNAIEAFLIKKNDYKNMGLLLEETIRSRFGIKQNFHLYNRFIAH